MSIDFSIQHSQVQPTSRDTTASSAVTGSLFGNTATVVESPLSLLAEAAEELTPRMISNWRNARNGTRSTRPWKNASRSIRR